MFEKYVDMLSKISLFQDITKEDITVMLNCIKPKISQFKKNDLIAISGDEFKSVGIVIAGKAVVVKENAAGNRMFMTNLNPGDMFGEMAVFSGKSILPSTVQAQDKCTVLFLPGEKIIGECKNLCPWHRTLIRNMFKIISNRALVLNKHVEYLNIKNLRGKISTFLIEQYKKSGKSTFKLPLKRNELAEFLNVSRPSLSREMCHMRDEGLIDFNRSSFHIKDVEGLKNMSE
jgi:CRP-like cAMP-binding protein